MRKLFCLRLALTQPCHFGADTTVDQRVCTVREGRARNVVDPQLDRIVLQHCASDDSRFGAEGGDAPFGQLFARVGAESVGGQSVQGESVCRPVGGG